MSLSASPTAGLVPASIPDSYGGVYAAKVFSTADPSGTGCIQMYVPQIFGTAPVKIWAPPCIPGGDVPLVGSIVWCIFQGGDPSYPTYLPPAPAAASVQYTLTTDFSVAAGAGNVTALSGAFTPTGSSVKVELTSTGYSDQLSPRTYFSVTNGTQEYLLCAPATPWVDADIFAGGSALFTGLTPGIEYTFHITVQCWEGNYGCRAATFPSGENMRMILSNG